jgi:hypothetical protein
MEDDNRGSVVHLCRGIFGAYDCGDHRPGFNEIDDGVGRNNRCRGWLFAVIWWLIPFRLAYVTITAKGSSSRWANVVLGIVATLLNLYHFFMCAVPVVQPILFQEPIARHILLLGTALAATALIVWYAWKWPKEAT